MTTSRAWKDEIELMQMFSIDTEAEGAKDFSTLCSLTALFVRFPDVGKTFYDVAAMRMRELHWSPVVFFGRIKRAIRPLYDAELGTLADLGLPVDAETITVPALVKAVARVMSAELPESFRENAEEAAKYIDLHKPEPKRRGNGAEK